MLKDTVNILGISVTYVLNKVLKMKKCGYPNLYAPGQPCLHKCEECKVNPRCGCCYECRWVRNECEKCTARNKLYKLLKTRVVGGPSIGFTRYCKARKSKLRYHDAKICARVMEFTVNSLYLYCSSQKCLAVRSNTMR